jgi:2-keto-4-pentenoate hydratase/2-oxohepta-3-ene-1,7-dioic acid hydratase in catechol pathway
MSRYIRREIAVNDLEQYDKLFEKRGVREIVQYRSPMGKFVTDEEVAAIDCHQIVWKIGMSYEKLAHEFYGDFRQWWVIAGFNKKPTESHINAGDTIRIPKNISEVLEVLE